MPERIRAVSKKEFTQAVPILADLLAQAMAQTPPWKGVIIDREATAKRFINDSQTGTETLVAQIGGEIVGATMYCPMSLQTIKTSEDLAEPEVIASYLEKIHQKTGIGAFVYIDKTFVSPSYQNQGIASRMRVQLLEKVAQENPDGVIVFTAHASNNPAIIKSSQRLGFLQTGIKMVSEADENLFNQYWVKIISPE